ncbi:unnamed protein product [Albugo candida]|uniref:Mitochondrial import inner membrane translocase subunit TIM16 n=1 Tax=Albugo candida TaxID=65357 RepID=A0A024GMQ5_9STRA|nr:unnamed protein product [Albugo candida]|eukprot:CCI48053.1 unnamed protein product [Albugo candida]
MAGPLGRIVAQIIVMSTGVISRAFVQAYRQAVHNASHGNVASTAAKTTLRKKNEMPLQQAREILNFPSSSTPTAEEVQKQFERYFKANDPSSGGSYYLQSKIHTAKETLSAVINKAQ